MGGRTAGDSFLVFTPNHERVPLRGPDTMLELVILTR
jgi:hypothetical protein